MLLSHIARVALVVAVVALTLEFCQAGSVKSGPQVGDKVPGAFSPLNINGPDAGKKSCQYCKNGSRPVVAIFVKEVTPGIAELVKKIDTVTAANKERGLGSYVVVCSDAAGMEQLLKTVADKMQIQNTVLTLYKAGGPERYGIAADADVTVLIYNHFTIKTNHAFKAGELNSQAINAVVGDVVKMLTED
jgi:hypothetical protein